MKANQFFVSKSLEFFRPVYDGRMGLTCVNESGYDSIAPCLFFGMYRNDDLERLFNHKGPRIVLWGGGDAQKVDVLKVIGIFHDIKHISTSQYIDHALRMVGLEPTYVSLPATIPERWVNQDAPPATLGNKIYCYAPNELYGLSIAQLVGKEVPYEIIYGTSDRSKDWKVLKELYSQCFMGLRLKEFDGVAATVQEMGLMGRRTVWNGGTPSAIAWNSVDDILRAIEKEALRIGKTAPVEEVSRQVQSWICTNNDWLEV